MAGRTADAMVPRRIAAVRLLALALPMLAGCRVGPDFTTPTASVAAQWQAAADPAVKADHAQDAKWWTGFGDPVLDRLVDLAYRQNLTLLAAGTQVLQARARLGLAIGEIYPQTQQIQSSMIYNKPGQLDLSNSPLELENYWRGTFGLTLGWELDFWGKFRRGVASADAAYLASIATYDDVLVALIADIATTYFGIRTLEAQLLIAEENVAKQQASLQIARDRAAGGVATGLDVAQAENVLAQTQAAIPRLTAELQRGKDALLVLLGLPPGRLDDLLAGAGGIPSPPGEVTVGIPADLLQRRPDVRAVELRAAAQSEQIGIAKADLFPAFTIKGALGTVGSNASTNEVSESFTFKGLQFSFGPEFSWPILNYGQITNNVRVQDAGLQTLLIEYRNTVLQAQQQVEDALSAFLEGRKRVVLLHQSVAAAQKALEIGLTQYKLGTRDFTTVLTAEQNLYQAQSDLAAASGQLCTSVAALYRALGGGWQLREGHDVVDEATRKQMRERTDWGRLLPPPGAPAPAPQPGLPGPADRGPDIQAPQW
ncbi:MAG: efflux transporter outer membrane subunit [Dongiaceae bacterium]